MTSSSVKVMFSLIREVNVFTQMYMKLAARNKY